MLKHMIIPSGGSAASTPGDRQTNHSLESFVSDKHVYASNGHVPTTFHTRSLKDGLVLTGRLPNGHIQSPRLKLSTSKHSLGGGTSSSVSPATNITTTPKIANGGLNISRGRPTRSPNGSILLPENVTRFITKSKEAGIKEMLTSLGLLCLVSLLLALLSLIFLLKITPVTAAEVKDLMRPEQLTIISPDEYVVVYEVTLALCSLTLSLNLCCLLVCAVQFLFAVKLVKSSENCERTNKYLQKSSITRVCAVGGFFVSIPVFLTGIILYTFIQFHSTPAIITSSLIGAGIIFCGCAMVHNVFVWQMEKTNAVRALAQQTQAARLAATSSSSTRTTPEEMVSTLSKSLVHSPGIPPATLDLSGANGHELSTLV